MSNGVGFTIVVLRVEHMDCSEDARHSIIRTRNAYNMDMVRHEAIGPDIEVMFPGVLIKQFEVARVIFCFGEHGLPVISPLGDMVRIAYGYGTGYSRHASTLRWMGQDVIE
jgi:hypothetical protein